MIEICVNGLCLEICTNNLKEVEFCMIQGNFGCYNSYVL